MRLIVRGAHGRTLFLEYATGFDSSGVTSASSEETKAADESSNQSKRRRITPDEATANPAMAGLEVDKQSQEFLKTRQQLRYFIVTGSMVVLAFVVNSAMGVDTLTRQAYVLLLATTVFAFGSAGFSISSIYYDLESTRWHLRLRYRGESYDDLVPTDQGRWDKVNHRSRRHSSIALGSLAAEIVLASSALAILVLGISTIS